MKTRRDFLTWAGLGTIALGFPRLGKSATTDFQGSEKSHPNVLIITTDQQQVGATSAMGNKWLKTPHMDSIAAQGVYFMRSYCSYPLCSPSRGSLHTSRTPHEIGVNTNGLAIDPNIPVSGQLFRAAGYDTGYAGKWHLPESYPLEGIPGFEVLNKISRKDKLAHEVDEATMNVAIEFLKRKHKAPFLLVASFINPHDICLLAGEEKGLAEEVWRKYQPPADAELPPLPPNFAKTLNNPLSTADGKHPEWDETHWRKYRYAYYRLLEDVDRQVGQVLAALRETGQEEDTLIIFTSDHGEGLGSHHWTGKMMYFEEEAEVPLMVSWKGVTPAGRIDRHQLVSTLDVLPTICDYAGVAGPQIMRGTSLRPVIEKPESAGYEFVVSEMAYNNMGAHQRSFMLRTQQYKYMTFPDAKNAELLLDMTGDPGEMKNLAGEAAVAGELERHRQLLALWKKSTEEDNYPLSAKSKKGKKAAKKKKQSDQKGTA